MTSRAAAPPRPGHLVGLVALMRAHADPFTSLGIALLPFALLGRALLPGRVLSPADILLVFPPWSVVAPGTRMANGLLTDVAFMFHPWFIYAGRELREGRFPLWNPHAFGGAPFFANPQTALLFPLTWLAVILPATLAVTLIAILKLSLAGVGMYWFLRLLDLRLLAAVVGALAFMLNGALVTWLQWPVGTGIAALPFLFAATEWLVQRPGTGRVVTLALTVALAIFGGYLQTTAVAILSAGVWALIRARATAHPVAVVARWAGGAVLGLALTAVQLLPFFEYMGLSSVYFYRSQWMPVMAAPPHAAIALLMPHYFGSPTGRDFWGYWNYNEIASTVGLVPWLVLPAALVGAWRRPATRFFTVLGALAAVVAYEVPALTALLGALPPVSLVIAFRFVAFLAFALCVLGAIGVEVLASGPPEQRRSLHRAVRIGFVALVAVALAFVVADRALLEQARLRVSIDWQFVWFLGLLTVGALGALGLGASGRVSAMAGGTLVVVAVAAPAPLAASYNPVTDTRTFFPTTPAVEQVQGAAGAERTRVMFGIGKNMGMLYGLYEVTGYDGMTPRRVEEVVSPVTSSGFNLIASGSLNVTANWAAPVFDLLGVGRIIVPLEPQRLPDHWEVEHAGLDARVFRNPRALPRAFLVPHARWCVDDGTALRSMHGNEINFRQEVLIADCDGAPAVRAGVPGVARVEIARYEAERVVLHSHSDAAGYLVLTDTWFPGWRARVDGVERPVLRADHAFRAVWLPAGHHEVEFVYQPASVRWGLGISLAAALGFGWLAAWPRVGRRRRTALGLAVGLLASPGVVEATSLPAGPLRLDVSLVRVGEEATIHVRVGDAAAESRTQILSDLYIARIPSGPPYPSYLTPAGAWTRTVTPYQRHVFLPRFTRVDARWREEGPPGWATVLVLLCYADADPTDRRSWVFRPLVARVRVGTARSASAAPADARSGSSTTGRVWPLVVGGVVAVAIVLFLPRPGREP